MEVERLKRIIMVLTVAVMMATILIAASVPALAHQGNPLVFVPSENVPPEISIPAEGTTYTCFAAPFSWGRGTGSSDNTCAPLQAGPPAGLVCEHPITFVLFGYRVPAFMCHTPT